MKKIYSLLLMAAMLFVGTNAWAGTYSVGTTEDFENAWSASASEDVVINLTSVVTLSNVMWLGTTSKDATSHSVVINLNNKGLIINGSSYGFLLTHGSLTINGNGTINASCGKELFFVTGSNEHATDYTTLKIGQGVTINYDTYLAAISIDGVRATTDQTAGDYAVYGNQPNYKPAKGQLGYNTKIYTNPVKCAAMGVKVEVDGAIHAQRYAVKTNGDLGYLEADKAYAPYVHIQSNAVVDVWGATDESVKKKPIALYASGYANWLIEGNVVGNVGVLVKSGDVDINGASITSSNTTAFSGPNNSTSGSEAQGSAVVISSENAYSGQMDVTISGNATMTAGAGYALEESVPGTAGTKVDVVTVQGGTFIAPTSGTTGGAVIISEETATAATGDSKTVEVQIISAVVNGSLTVTGDDAQGTKLQELTSTSAVLDPTKDADPDNDDDPTIIVPLEVKLNSNGDAGGFASFSAPINLYKKSGSANFTINVGAFANDVLTLTPVNYVEAGQGVILTGANLTKCEFTTTGTADNSYDGKANDLKPSTRWESQTDKDHIYCLRKVGEDPTMFYKYIGAEMPANKAYLDLSNVGGNYAPQRIRMIVAQEEQTEAVERVEAARVKAVKFVENGEILIRRGENVYNLQGQIVK